MLKHHALVYERLYFEDFTFQKGSIVGDISNRNKHKGYGAPSISKVHFNARKLKKTHGSYNARTKTITIDPDSQRVAEQDDKVIYLTLLHEMLHAYEHQFTHAQGEILTAFLYTKLKDKIKNLDFILVVWADFDNQELISKTDGSHAVLFLLKSLDIDIRLNLPLGTTSNFYGDYQDTLENPAGIIKIERVSA